MGCLKGVISTGFFRTGSTFFFSCMRQAASMKCFYEPYHPDILDYVEKEQKGLKAVEKDALKHTLDRSYFHEYINVDLNRMKEAFRRTERQTNHPVLAAGNSGKDIKQYINFLIEFAGQSRSIPLLQANRFNLMLPWLKENYPDYLIVLLTRNPREIYSSLSSLAVRENINLESGKFRSINYWNVSEIFMNIIVYFELQSYGLWEYDYYQRLYFSLCFIQRYMAQYADIVIDYNGLCSDYEFWIEAIMDSIGVNSTESVQYAGTSVKTSTNHNTNDDRLLKKELEVNVTLNAVLSNLYDNINSQ